MLIIARDPTTKNHSHRGAVRQQHQQQAHHQQEQFSQSTHNNYLVDASNDKKFMKNNQFNKQFDNKFFQHVVRQKFIKNKFNKEFVNDIVFIDIAIVININNIDS